MYSLSSSCISFSTCDIGYLVSYRLLRNFHLPFFIPGNFLWWPLFHLVRDYIFNSPTFWRTLLFVSSSKLLLKHVDAIFCGFTYSYAHAHFNTIFCGCALSDCIAFTLMLFRSVVSVHRFWLENFEHKIKEKHEHEHEHENDVNKLANHSAHIKKILIWISYHLLSLDCTALCSRSCSLSRHRNAPFSRSFSASCECVCLKQLNTPEIVFAYGMNKSIRECLCVCMCTVIATHTHTI